MKERNLCKKCNTKPLSAVLLTMLMFLFSATSFAQWGNVGIAGFSTDVAYNTSLAFDGTTPYVAYQDEGNGDRITVMKYTGTAWEEVGLTGVSASSGYEPSLAFNGSVPYVVYLDGTNDFKATVRTFDGTNWVDVGLAGFSAGLMYDPSLAFDGPTIYVAYRDAADSHKATVMKYDGINWTIVGVAGFSIGRANSISLAMDGSTPYVGYGDGGNGTKATVMKYDGTNWVYVGTAGFSVADVYNPAFALNGSSTPYIAYGDIASDSKITVMKYNGASWENVGNAGFSADRAYGISLAFDGLTPYVAYYCPDLGSKITVRKFNGSYWESVGAREFTAGGSGYCSLALDASIPYVAYQDGGNGYKASLMKFTPNTTTYTGSWSDGVPSAVQDAIIDADISISSNFECNNLTINASTTVTVAAGVAVTVKSVLTNNGTLVLKSPNDMSASASFIDEIGTINNGLMRAERYITPDAWHMMSSPMNAPISANVSYLDDYVSTYNESGTDEATAWTPLAPTGETIDPGTGYLVQSTSALNSNFVISFEGTFNTGDYVYENHPFTNEGYSLVANPFPSALDFSSGSGWTETSNNYSDSRWVWNGTVYATHNGITGTGTGNSAILPAMQAVFIKTTNGTNSSVFSHKSRVHSTSLYLKTTTVIPDLLRLQASGNNYTDEIVLYSANDNRDSEKFFSSTENLPQLFSIEDNKELSINKLQDVKSEFSIPLGFTCDISGIYTISATEFTFSSAKVLLEDLLTGTYVDLSQNADYQFSYTAESDVNRFVLHFNSTPTGVEKEINNFSTIYSHKNVIYINLAKAEASTITVFDFSGRKVKEIQSSAQVTQINDLTEGVYIVKVNSDTRRTVQKVFVK